MARPSTPAASACSIIAGKMVTTSKVIRLLVSHSSHKGDEKYWREAASAIEIQQSLRRLDDDALEGDVNRRANRRRQRDQHLTSRSGDDQPAAVQRAIDLPHETDHRAGGRFDS